MKILAAVAVLTAAGAFALGYGAGNLESEAGSSANRTAYSFVYAVNHGNLGRGCSWMSQDMKYLYCQAPGDYRIVKRTENPDGSVTYMVKPKSGSGGVAVFVVAKNADGKWRVQRLA